MPTKHAQDVLDRPLRDHPNVTRPEPRSLLPDHSPTTSVRDWSIGKSCTVSSRPDRGCLLTTYDPSPWNPSSPQTPSPLAPSPSRVGLRIHPLAKQCG